MERTTERAPSLHVTVRHTGRRAEGEHFNCALELLATWLGRRAKIQRRSKRKSTLSFLEN